MKKYLHIQASWDEEDGVVRFGTIEMVMPTSSGDQKRLQMDLRSWQGKQSMLSDLISVPWICSQIDRVVASFWRSTPLPEWKDLDKELPPSSTTSNAGQGMASSGAMEKNGSRNAH
jgi:hypothetical protein